MSGDSAGWGSMAVLEDFFDGVVGEDITKERVQALDPERGADLIARLCDVTPPKDPGLAGATEWRQSRSLDPRATLLIDFSAGRQVPACAVFVHQLLVEDPVSFPPDPLGDRGDLGRLLNNLGYDIASLATLRPLIETSAVVLYPPWTGVGMPRTIRDFLKEPLSADEDHRTSLWGPVLARWVDGLWAKLPQGQVGEIADAIMVNLLAASAFDVDVAATGRYVPMLPPALTTAGAAVTAYCDVLVPNLTNLDVADVVAVRQHSEVFARLRSALDQVVAQLLVDPERARQNGPQIA